MKLTSNGIFDYPPVCPKQDKIDEREISVKITACEFNIVFSCYM